MFAAMALNSRIIAWAAGAVAVGASLLLVNHWRTEAARVPQLEREFADYKREVEEAERIQRRVSRDYQKELADLRARKPVTPVVRLCLPPSVPEGDDAGGRSDPGSASGVLPPQVGGDIGGGLAALADRADEVSAQLRACQGLLSDTR